jgi:hypothetical protein
MKACHACGQAWEGSPGSQPGRDETCVKCGADMHVCLNCRLYDPSAHRECTSVSTEPPKNKEKRNFCEEFMMAGGAKGSSSPAGAPDQKKKWDDLFEF